MPRHEDRHSSSTRLYVGRLSSRTRSRDLEDIFSKYGRIRDVDMKRDYAFVEFSNSRDADDAKYSLNGREVDGSRISVEVAKGVPRSGYGGGGGGGGSREYQGRGPTPGTGRCFNCGLEGHWARDCKGGDWKNKCYRCGDRGHIERNCQNSPEKTGRARSYSRSPSPRRGRGRSRSYSRSRSLSRSRSPPPRRERERSRDRGERRRSRSPRRSPRPSKGRKHSPTPDRSPSEGGDGRRSKSPNQSPRGRKHSLTPERSPREGGVLLTSLRGTKPEAIVTKSTSVSPVKSPVAENGRSISPSRSLSPRSGAGSPIENDGSPRGSPTGSD